MSLLSIIGDAIASVGTLQLTARVVYRVEPLGSGMLRMFVAVAAGLDGLIGRPHDPLYRVPREQIGGFSVRA